MEQCKSRCPMTEERPHPSSNVTSSSPQTAQIANYEACFRPHDMKTTYMGASQIGGIAYFKDGVPKPIDEDYGLQMDHGVCCIYNPFDRNRVAWALSVMGPARETKTNLNTGDFEALKKEALETGRVFKEPFKSVVEATVQDTAFIKPVTTKDAFEHDELLESVFIGDANHILSPYEFVGANLALKDGWDLAEQICCHTSMKAAVASYDAISIPRFNHPFTFQNERVQFGHADGWKWSAYKVGMKAQRMSKDGTLDLGVFLGLGVRCIRSS